MTLPTLYLELDPSGAKVANKRDYEPHLVESRATRVIKPNFCAYFTESMKVWSIQGAVRVPLTRGTDFTCVELFEQATARIGKELCGAVLVHRQDLPSQFEITYQALGGYANIDYEAMAIAVRDLYATGETVDWNDILDKPTGFPPGPHLHDSADLYGLEYLSDSIQNLLYAIAKGDDFSETLLLNEITKSRRTALTALNAMLNTVTAHIVNTNNAATHNLTKGQIGLGSVENRHFVRRQINGVWTEGYSSPRTTFNQIKVAVLGDIIKHIEDMNNPHLVTKAQVLLGNVENYDVASVAEIVAGTATNKYVTPFRVASAVPILLGGILAHVNDAENPHQENKASVLLAAVDNFPMAVPTELDAGVSEDRFVTPADVKYLSDAYVGTSGTDLSNHSSNQNNPHEEDKNDVNLGSVSNFAVAVENDVISGFADDLYLTPKVVKDAMTTAVAGKLNTTSVDVANGAVPLSAALQVPGRLLSNVPDVYEFSLQHFFRGPSVFIDEMILTYVFSRAVTFLEDFAGSVARAITGPVTYPITVEVLKGEDVRLGAITFSPSADVGAVTARIGKFTTLAGPVSFASGEVMSLRITAGVLTELKGLSFHFKGKFDIAGSSNPMGGLMPRQTNRGLPYILQWSGRNNTGTDGNVLNLCKYMIGSNTTAANGGSMALAQSAGFGNSYLATVINGRVSPIVAPVGSTYTFRYSDEVLIFGPHATSPRYDLVAFGSEDIGIAFGGIKSDDTFSNVTEKYVYAADSYSPRTSFGQAIGRTQGYGTSRAGYIRGGSTLFLESDATTFLGKYSYILDTFTVGSTASTLSRFNTAACASPTVGVISGGTYQGTTLTTVQRHNFAGDTMSAGTALGDARQCASGASTAVTGFFSGGARSTGVVVDTGTRYTFADDTTTTATMLIGARQKHQSFSTSPNWR